MKKLYALAILLILSSQTLKAHVVDLHSHLAAHLPYGFMLFGPGPDQDAPEAGSYSSHHWYRQQLYKDWIRNSGVRLYVMAALPNIFAFTRSMAWKQVEEQLKYVEDFAAKFPNDFYVAHDPRAARIALEEGKTVFVHAVEGGEYLLDSEADASHWASRGVAMIGPIHLADNKYGEASIMEGFRGILNWKGLLRSGSEGLNKNGRTILGFMRDAGLIIDGAHMASTALDQTLTFAEKNNLPIVVSHTFFREIKNEERGLSKEQMTRMNSTESLIGLVLAPELLGGPLKPHLDSFSGTILGLGTDFNGFIDHLPEIRTPLDVPKLIENNRPEIWKNSAEKFLEIWEKVLQRKTKTPGNL